MAGAWRRCVPPSCGSLHAPVTWTVVPGSLTRRRRRCVPRRGRDTPSSSSAARRGLKDAGTPSSSTARRGLKHVAAHRWRRHCPSQSCLRAARRPVAGSAESGPAAGIRRRLLASGAASLAWTGRRPSLSGRFLRHGGASRAAWTRPVGVASYGPAQYPGFGGAVTHRRRTVGGPALMQVSAVRTER